MCLAFVRMGVCLWLLAVVGCGPTRPSQFKDGAKLYDRATHQYFGTVVGFAAVYDFHNGMPPQPAILIESVEGGSTERKWGACSTCAATFEVKP